MALAPWPHANATVGEIELEGMCTLEMKIGAEKIRRNTNPNP